MARCPKCGRSLPDGAFVDVIIQKGSRVTREEMCEPCGLEATKGLNQMMLDGGADVTDHIHQMAREYVRDNKKW
jgi:hypothetical protein